jgi:transcriptional regulator with XRE-family HTH domain
VIRAYPPHEWRTVPIDGQRLRQIRAERGLSQQKLAYKTDLGLTTIRRLEVGPRSACRAWTLDLIADALGTQPDKLTTETDSPSQFKPGSNVLAITAARARRRGHAS